MHHAVVVLNDRGQGAQEELAEHDIALQAVKDLTTMVSVLLDEDQISAANTLAALSFAVARCFAASTPALKPRSFEERARYARAPMVKVC